MAGHSKKYGRHGYRTAAQRRALKKAQLASARKRRLKAGAKAAGYVAGGIIAAAAIGGATNAANTFANHPIKTTRKIKGAIVGRRIRGK